MPELQMSKEQAVLMYLLRGAVQDLWNWADAQQGLGASCAPAEQDAQWGTVHASPQPRLQQPQVSHEAPAPVRQPSPVAVPAQSASKPAPSPQMDCMASFMAMRKAQQTPRLQTASERGMALDILKARCGACRMCPLGAKRRGVFCGSGPVDARLMFIAAGGNPAELDAGRIITGDCAELFDKIVLAMASLHADAAPERIYRTNVLKCACVPARNIAQECAAKCMAYVREEVQVVAPKVIVVWGQMAFRAMFGSDALISQVRGQIYHYEGATVIATHHPMELLKQPALKRRVWEDVKMAASML